jgi:hypothetical protein
MFPDENLTNKWERVEETKERNVSLGHWDMWKVINFHSVSHVPYSTSFILEFISYKNDLVSALYQALCKLVRVRFHTTEFWESEISTN